MTFYINKAQEMINTKFPYVQKDFAQSTAIGIAGSFACSLIFAKDNHLGAALTGSAVTLLASVVDAVFKIAAKKGWGFLETKISINSFNNYQKQVFSDISKIIFFTTLYAGRKFNLQINNKASVCIAIPLYFINLHQGCQTPINFFVVHG